MFYSLNKTVSLRGINLTFNKYCFYRKTFFCLFQKLFHKLYKAHDSIFVLGEKGLKLIKNITKSKFLNLVRLKKIKYCLRITFQENSTPI